ncbi:MAG: hypothetical protein ACO25F_02195 [Erythrobacter sp.]
MARALREQLDRLRPRVTALAQAISRNRARFRIPLLLLAIAIFVGGVAISVNELSLNPGQIRYGPLAALALIVAPLAIAYSAVNMTLMGKAIGVPIGFASGIRISVFAQVAELLPIPGGAIVRPAALMKGGGGGLQSTGIVLAFAFLWIAWAAAGGGLALWSHDQLGLVLLAVGLLAILAISYWLWAKYGWNVALAANMLRVLGVLLTVMRIVVAFWVLSLAIGWSDAFGFAFGVVLGSAASIVPAGLGIGESISALIAIPLKVEPAAAFLAVAISRLAGFAVNMLLATIFLAFPAWFEGTTDHE